MSAHADGSLTLLKGEQVYVSHTPCDPACFFFLLLLLDFSLFDCSVLCIVGSDIDRVLRLPQPARALNKASGAVVALVLRKPVVVGMLSSPACSLLLHPRFSALSVADSHSGVTLCGLFCRQEFLWDCGEHVEATGVSECVSRLATLLR